MDSMIGIMIFALAGFSSAAFYTPLKYVKWKWEVMWIFYSLFACLAAPIVIATLAMPDCWTAIGRVEFDVIAKTFVFGALWGVGGLTFGLSMRYLGIGLGTAVALGFCALVGTLSTPVLNGTFSEIVSTRDGLLKLVGVFVCALGIAVNGVAGIMKERDTSSAEGGNGEFSLAKGFLVAVVAGSLSACMSISMGCGAPIADKALEMAIAAGADKSTSELFKNSPILIITLLGGFLTNFLWCLFLAFKNKTIKCFGEFSAAGNIAFVVLCALGGLLWYCQFFLYGMGMTKLDPSYAFTSWAILMAFIIVFAGAIGLIIGEWRGTTPLTKSVLVLGMLVLAASTFVMSM